MPDDSKPERPEVTAMVAQLTKETGISDAQARSLISMLGLNWSSLVREARLLRKAH